MYNIHVTCLTAVGTCGFIYITQSRHIRTLTDGEKAHAGIQTLGGPLQNNGNPSQKPQQPQKNNIKSRPSTSSLLLYQKMLQTQRTAILRLFSTLVPTRRPRPTYSPKYLKYKINWTTKASLYMLWRHARKDSRDNGIWSISQELQDTWKVAWKWLAHEAALQILLLTCKTLWRSIYSANDSTGVILSSEEFDNLDDDRVAELAKLSNYQTTVVIYFRRKVEHL